jgi:hypothetical protein
MNYPKGFPKHLERLVDQAIADAEFKLGETKQRGGLNFTNMIERLFLPYVSQIYFAFGIQVCQAVREVLCTGEEARAYMDTFLHTILHRAYFDNYSDVSSLLANGDFDGRLKVLIRNAEGWRAFQKSLTDAFAEQGRPSASGAPLHEKTASRQSLRDAYRAIFPDERILDICWAAGQHYSEWKRWLRGAVKDDSTPDRAFRALLASGKRPKEYKKQLRPDGWK